MEAFFATKKGGKSARGNTCCQLFVTDKGFVYVVPMRTKKDVTLAVKQFAKEIGVPDAIVCDAAGEQTSIELRRFLNSIGTTIRVLEQGTPWANRAELYVGLMKEAVRRDMRDSNCPFVFWDYCVERRARVNNLTAKDSFQLRGQTPQTEVTGDPGDISNLKSLGEFLAQQPVWGMRCVSGYCKVLQGNGTVISRRTVRPLKTEGIHSPEEEQKRQLYDSLIEKKHGPSFIKLEKDLNSEEDGTTTNAHMSNGVASEEEEDHWELYKDDEQFARPMPDVEDQLDIHGHLINQQSAYDLLLNLEIRNESGEHGKVV
ncbi:unnamed protein product [Cylindrotheca closterium]|uniref:Integrase catalytic domain-containing protein n=1 Tax=Cylindrotheca closterium TaxID=2856 RepID=A0AAD2G1K5_9STRA|nr:unnamed protein product [Cylindrotheca closterium]